MTLRRYSKKDIQDCIARYERHHLEQTNPAPRTATELLSGRKFLHVQAVGNFWTGDHKEEFTRRVTDFVIGAHSFEGDMTFLLTGDRSGVALYLALGSEESARSMLTAAYPGIQLIPVVLGDLQKQLEPRLSSMGMLSGIPSGKQNAETGKQTAELEAPFHLERIVRGMAGRGAWNPRWAVVIQAHALAGTNLRKERDDLFEEAANFAGMMRGQLQQSVQKSKTDTDHENRVLSEMLGGEVFNKDAEYAVKLLEHQQVRLDAAMATGRWQVGVYFGAADPQDYDRLAALLTGAFAGLESRPEPVRARPCRAGGEPFQKFHSYLTSEELSLLCRPLREEAPGYQVLDIADFDVAYRPHGKPALLLGDIWHDGQNTGQEYSIPLEDLPSHGAVFGVTGSGKTSTILGLLHRLRERKPALPFMVIEPAKTEYRALMGKIDGGRPRGIVPDLQTYTLGSDTVAPFRLNPFEFDLGKTPGFAPLLSHIDFLKAVFNAAFILYAPMPYVLETALYEVYEERGWNLATERNVRLTETDWVKRDQYPIFPTLTDLYDKVGQVTARLGYNAEIEQNVIAGLQARIGSLRLGSKGSMLDTPRGIQLGKLLEKPVILELENIGSDDEKTFLIGLILSRLYGYRKLQAAEGDLDGSLQHVLVIEEAHRLLKNVSTQVDVESANPRAQAIETFMNMLSEVRHYGQSVLIAEQIPSKLTPDVIKNTNLKVVHRILAEDDRKLLGGSMNMSENQTRRLANLQPGEAAVFTRYDDRPMLVKMEDIKAEKSLAAPLSKDLPPWVASYMSVTPYLLVPDFASYGIRISTFGGPDSVIFQSALVKMNRPESSRTWARLLARVIFSRKMLPGVFDQLRQQIRFNPEQLKPPQYAEGLQMLLVLGSALAINRRGAENDWPYGQADAMRQALTNGLTLFAAKGDLRECATELDRFSRLYEDGLKLRMGPFDGCRACRTPCFYRPEVIRLVSSIEINGARKILASPDHMRLIDKYGEIKKELMGKVQAWLGGEGSDIEDLAYCVALHIAPALYPDEYDQSDFATNIAGQLFS